MVLVMVDTLELEQIHESMNDDNMVLVLTGDNMVLVQIGDNMELLDDDMELVNDMTSDKEMLMVMNDDKEEELNDD